MWNPLSWVMEAAAIMAIALANGGVSCCILYSFLLKQLILIMVLNCGCGYESLHSSEMWSMQLRRCCLNLEILYIATAIAVVQFKTMILILKFVDANNRTKKIRNSC